MSTLGDVIDRDFDNFDRVLDVYGGLRHRTLFLPGNHDFAVAHRNIWRSPRRRGSASPITISSARAMRVILTDGNEVSLFARRPAIRAGREAEAGTALRACRSRERPDDGPAGMSAARPMSAVSSLLGWTAPPTTTSAWHRRSRPRWRLNAERGEILAACCSQAALYPSISTTSGAQTLRGHHPPARVLPTRTERALLRLCHGHAIAQAVGPARVSPGRAIATGARTLRAGAGHISWGVDISADYLRDAIARLRVALLACMPAPWARTSPGCAPPDRRAPPRLPGSSIGNFDPPQALALLRHMRELALDDGGLLIRVRPAQRRSRAGGRVRRPPA